MDTREREKIISIITKREKLRPLSRLSRLFRDPIRAIPYYILATISHIKPYQISWKTPWGDRLTGYLPEANTFYYYGYCEANLTSFFLRFVRPSMTILDVGAHIGFYSSLLSRLVGTSGHIESFEPTPWTFSLLKKNAGDSRNVTLNNVALANSEGRLEFSDYGPGFGAYNSASQDGAFINKPHRTISVPALTLDGFCAKNHITPDLIKIDAEGLEYSILQGMTTIIRSVRPLITLEMANGEAWAEGCAKASQLLLDNSYAAYEMEDDGHIKPHQMQHSYEYTNILFVPKEKTQSITDFIK